MQGAALRAARIQQKEPARQDRMRKWMIAPTYSKSPNERAQYGAQGTWPGPTNITIAEVRQDFLTGATNSSWS